MRNLRLTRPHMRGHDVGYLIKRLRHHGITVPPSEEYDDTVTIAVRAFQGMYNLDTTGVVDDATWTVLGEKCRLPWPMVDGGRQMMIDAAWKVLGVPYIHGSDNPMLGLDPLGFLKHICMSPPYCTDDLAQYLEENFHTVAKADMMAGDIVVYSRKDGRLTHVLLVLNDIMGIGPIGGNAATNTREMATKRDACVKVKNIRYRSKYDVRRLKDLTFLDQYTYK